MAKKAVFVDLTKYPDLYDSLMELARQDYTSPAPIVRKFIEKGLKEKGFKVTGKKVKTSQIANKPL